MISSSQSTVFDVKDVLALANSIRNSAYRRIFDHCVSLRMHGLTGKVSVVKSPHNYVEILVDADDEFIKELAISCENGRLSVRSSSANNSNVFTSGNGINVVSSNNGQKKEPQIIIMVPMGIGIISKNFSDSLIAGINGDLTIEMFGKSKAKIIGVKDLEITCSGETETEANNVFGNVKVRSSGKNTFNMSGEMEEIEIEASGLFDTDISGVIRKNLFVDSSGIASVNCFAKVSGEVKKNCSGICNVNIF